LEFTLSRLVVAVAPAATPAVANSRPTLKTATNPLGLGIAMHAAICFALADALAAYVIALPASLPRRSQIAPPSLSQTS